jgi:hypothetical protein
MPGGAGRLCGLAPPEFEVVGLTLALRVELAVVPLYTAPQLWASSSSLPAGARSVMSSPAMPCAEQQSKGEGLWPLTKTN